MPLSVFIICCNEAHIIAKTLSQARLLADEIVVVDSGSSDQTLEIAKQFADKIIKQNWLGYAAQKNFALEQTSHEWVLSLDADEVLSDAGIVEIQETLKQASADVYKIPRKLYIGSRFIRFGGYYPDYQSRLFKRGLAKFKNRAVHESLDVPSGAKIGYLKEALEHYAYKDLEDMRASFMHYAKLARQANPSKLPQPWVTLLAQAKYLYVFCWKYFVRLGILEGSLGLALALLHADYSRRKILA